MHVVGAMDKPVGRVGLELHEVTDPETVGVILDIAMFCVKTNGDPE